MTLEHHHLPVGDRRDHAANVDERDQATIGSTSHFEAGERWLGDNDPASSFLPRRRVHSFGGIAAAGAVALTSIFAMNSLKAGATDQRGIGGPGFTQNGAPPGFGPAPGGTASTGGPTNPAGG